MLVLQSCLTLCYPMDCNPLESSVYGILQARILEWVGTPFSRGSSQLRNWTRVSCIADRFFTIWTTREAPLLLSRPSNCFHLMKVMCPPQEKAVINRCIKYKTQFSLWNVSVQFSSVQSLCCVWLFVTSWTAACQASLSITNSQSVLKLMSID